ncbi:hypothetical protein RHO14_05430 [Orbus wheelerorum]|uniref:hypothetical protein n=1 Tax=Orbus wheelerorum TaxID=3074111 RepID=UPI00370D26AF
MNNLSFFKLPLILVIICWLMAIVTSITMMMINAPEYVNLGNYVINVAFNKLFYGLPKHLLIMFIASLAFYRCHIYQITVKNILSLITISLMMNVIVILFDNYILSFIMSYLYPYLNYLGYEAVLLIHSFIPSLLNYIVVGLVIYYGILNLQNRFDRAVDFKVIDADNRVKTHVILFALLFISLSLLFLTPILPFYSASYISGYLIVVIIIALIVYFSIRNCFTIETDTLETARIIKSTLLSFLFSAIANIVISLAMAFLIIMVAYGEYQSNQSDLIMIVFLGFGLQIVLTSLILRAVTKRYFARASNETSVK